MSHSSVTGTGDDEPLAKALELGRRRTWPRIVAEDAGRCRSNAHQHSRDVLRDRFLAPRRRRDAQDCRPCGAGTAAAMTPRFRHTHRVVRPHDPSRQAGLRKHGHFGNIDMGGDFIGRWRAGSGRRTARQANPGPYSAKVLACGPLLLSGVIVVGMATQTALAEIAAPAATHAADHEKEQGEPGVAQPSQTQKSEPETVLRQPEVQKPAPEAAVQTPEARESSHEAKDLPVPQLVLPGDLPVKKDRPEDLAE